MSIVHVFYHGVSKPYGSLVGLIAFPIAFAVSMPFVGAAAGALVALADGESPIIGGAKGGFDYTVATMVVTTKLVATTGDIIINGDCTITDDWCKQNWSSEEWTRF